MSDYCEDKYYWSAVLILVVLVTACIALGYILGSWPAIKKADEQRAEICAEAKHLNYKLQSCGYYKWEVTP